MSVVVYVVSHQFSRCELPLAKGGSYVVLATEDDNLIGHTRMLRNETGTHQFSVGTGGT